MSETKLDHKASLSVARPYIRTGNLYCVPVLRNRLVFAEAVRQSIRLLDEDMPWNPRRDLIAVTLPESMQPTLLEAIRRLPDVSLVVAVVLKKGAREAFGVTPCDPFVEAIRTAQERHWMVKFVDLELAPGNLLHGLCAKDPNWPDDLLIEVIGIESYLNLIEGYFTTPPARLEPVDSLRENAVAANLRRLQPLWRRILVVTDAGIYRSVMSQLCSPVPFETSARQSGAPCSVELRTNLSLTALLRHLDDYPRLIERYEGARHSNDAFSKYHELWEEVMRFAQGSIDMKFSVRQYLAFATFLKNLLKAEHQVSPKPDVLYLAAAGCFGKVFAERLIFHLVGYQTQITTAVERITARSLARNSTIKLDVAIRPGGKYFSRTCNPYTEAYDIAPPLEGRNREKFGRAYSWDDDTTFRRLQKRLTRIASEVEPSQVVLPYRGSICNGVHIRRTIRARYRGDSGLYVKAEKKNRRRAKFEYEPTVWVLSENVDQPGSFVSKPLGEFFEDMIDQVSQRPGESFPIMSMLAVGSETVRTETQTAAGGKLWCADQIVRLTFGTRFDNEKDARDHFGQLFPLRFPNHDEFEHPCGCVHRDFVAQADDGRGWLTVSLLTALKYADRDVIVIAPLDFTVPREVLHHPLMIGKAFHVLPLGRFSRDEIEMIGTRYQYEASGADERAAKAAFTIIMRRYRR